MSISATHVQAAEASVTVLSNSREVTDWAQRYFGPWWNARDVDAAQVCAGPVVLGDVDKSAYADLAALVGGASKHEEVLFAKAATRVARDGDDVIAVSPSQCLAYRAEPASGRLTIVGTAAEPVALATARLARESIRGQLLRAGWAVLHSSAVVNPANGETVLAFGSKGAGKTTSAFLLAASGWHLLANDRVFVRAGDDGVEVAPWPSAAALGFGLLDALGWYNVAKTHLQMGEKLHPTQHQDVTDALLAGRKTPLWEAGDKKREKKVQVFPDQFPDWFDVPLATGGRAAMLLFPQITPDGDPRATDAHPRLGDADFMSGATEDRYPDIFGLAHGIDGGGAEQARAGVTKQLSQLPHFSVVLNHDVPQSAAFLDKLTAS